MPIYEYECSKCSRTFEAMQKITDAPLKRCKFCNGTVERLISTSSFQLKGSGWYLTDYARKSSGGGDSTPSSDSSSGSTSGSKDKGSESKPSKSEKPSTKKDS